MDFVLIFVRWGHKLETPKCWDAWAMFVVGIVMCWRWSDDYEILFGGWFGMGGVNGGEM